MLIFICCDGGQYLRVVIAKKAQLKLKYKCIYVVAMAGWNIRQKKADLIGQL